MRSGTVAAFLAFICPGLGHYYAGLPRRAARVVLIQVAADLLVVLVAGYGIGLSAITLALVLLLAIVVPIAVIVDAYKQAARDPVAEMRPKVPRSYLLLWLLVVIAASTLFSMGVKSRLQAFRIPAPSMEPTLLVGDYLYVDKGATPQRGDVLVFRYPEDPSFDYIKRCVGVPGDTLSFRDRVLHRNGVAIDEPYAQYVDVGASRPGLGSFGPIVVPEGHLFVLGDNRDRSSDSRVWGFLDIALVRGRASHIYWSWDQREENVRWERIGESIH